MQLIARLYCYNYFQFCFSEETFCVYFENFFIHLTSFIGRTSLQVCAQCNYANCYVVQPLAVIAQVIPVVSLILQRRHINIARCSTLLGKLTVSIHSNATATLLHVSGSRRPVLHIIAFISVVVLMAMNDEWRGLKDPFVSYTKSKYDPSARSTGDTANRLPVAETVSSIKIQVAFDAYLPVCPFHVIELDSSTARK